MHDEYQSQKEECSHEQNYFNNHLHIDSYVICCGCICQRREKIIVIADHSINTSVGGIKKDKRTVNPAEKAAKVRIKADHNYLKTRAKTDGKRADEKAAKEKNEADTKAAKDLETNLK